MGNVDERLLSMRIPLEVLEWIVEDSYLSGEIYYEACVNCRDYKVCVLISVMLEDIELFKTVLEGLLIHVNKDRAVDEEVEILMKLSKIVRYENNVAKFYIPPLLSKSAFMVACRDFEWSNYNIRKVPVEEAYQYIEGDEDGVNEDEEMA